MKKLFNIIILISIAYLSYGQYQTPNRLFKGIDIVGSDTLLLDTITGVGDPDMKVIGCDWDVSLQYYPGKTKAQLIRFGKDTISFNRIPENNDDGDTLFAKWEEHVLNSDSTELYPYRVTRMAFYNSATPDLNDYFGALVVTGTTIIVPDDYSTIDAAIIAASTGDTILIKGGIYRENHATNHNMYVNKDLYIEGIGAVEVRAISGAVAVMRITTTGTKVKGLKLNAENTLARCVYTTLNLNLYNMDLTGTTYLHYQSGATYNDTILKCNFYGGNNVGSSNCITSQFSMYFSENYINTLHRQNFYHTATGGKRELLYNKIVTNNQNYYTEYNNQVSGEYITRFNEYVFDTITLTGIAFLSASTGSVLFEGNTITSNGYLDEELFYIVAGASFSSTTINNNTINYLKQGTGGFTFYVWDQSHVNIYDNEFTCVDTLLHNYIYLSKGSAGKDSVIFIHDNNFNIKNKSGHTIGVGSETSNAYNDLFDSIYIYGNYINNYDISNNTNHNIFVGHNLNPHIYNNYIKNGGYAFVLKHSAGSYSSENISYNIIDSSYFTFRVKGIEDVDIYHSVVYGSIYGAYISNNDGAGSSLNTSFINNIFSNNTENIRLDAGGGINESNYNIFYQGTLNTSTFSAWQALGYDANSYNTNPNFYNASAGQFWLKPPSNGIGKGKKLSYPFNIGLSIGATYPDPPLEYQKTLTSMGAYINKLNIAFKSGTQLIKYNNSLTTQ